MVHAPPQINTATLWTLVFRAQALSTQIRRGATPELAKSMGDTMTAYAAELEKLQGQCGQLHMLGYRTDPKTPFAGQIICKPKPSAGMNAAEKGK